MVDEYLTDMVVVAALTDDGQVDAEVFGIERRRQRHQTMKEKMIVPKKTPKTIPSATAELCADDDVSASTGDEKLVGVSSMAKRFVGRKGVALSVVAVPVTEERAQLVSEG